jgi:hypothetical protein
MTIHKNEKDDDWEIACDRCAGGEQKCSILAFEKFADAVARFKQLGWKIIRHGNGTYEHRCPDCARDIQNNGRQTGLF